MFGFLRDPGTDGVGIAFSDRHGGVTPGVRGSLNLGRSDVDPDGVVTNLRLVTEALGLTGIVLVHQVHGADVFRPGTQPGREWTPEAGVGDARPGQPSLPVADAVVATRAEVGPRTALAVRVADCLPVVLADPRVGVIGVAHAGRPGLFAGVLEATLDQMQAAGATDVQGWIGPHVCGDCYEVPAEMAEEGARRLPATRAVTSWGTPALDLAAGAEQILAGRGVEVTHVGGCTRTDPSLHSHRRDATDSEARATGVDSDVVDARTCAGTPSTTRHRSRRDQARRP